MSFKYVGKEHYISLITKQLNKELNTSELQELNNWLSASSDNATLVSDFKQVWNSVSSYKSTASFDVDAAYSDFVKKYNIPQSSGAKTVSPKTSLSATRLFFALLTVAALVLGGIKLSDKLNNSYSADFAKVTIPLSNFSSATLAPSTSLRFNKKDFNLSKLDGQVYLELEEKKGTAPLRLDMHDVTANANNVVLNIENSDDAFTADIARGSVKFSVNDETVELTEGQRLVYSEKDKKHTVLRSDSNAFAWQKGILSFDNTPLYEVFDEIEKFYGVTITVTDGSPVNQAFTAFNYKPASLNECLELLSSSIEMTITRDERNIEVSNIKTK